MVKIAVVGGGWSGCAAALAAAKAGAEVTLFERTDLLLGTGLVGGIFRNNGRYTAAEEAICLGANELFDLMDTHCRHRGIDFPGHHHASLYDVTQIEKAVRGLLIKHGITLHTETRIHAVQKYGGRITAIIDDNDTMHEYDAYVDASGTAGPMGNCLRHGNGCAMCIMRCPSFGPRVSLAERAHVPEQMSEKADGSFGAMSGSCKIKKESLSPALRNQLDQDGVLVIPLPPAVRQQSKLGKKACSQYAIPAFADNLVVLDTGHAKIMTPYISIDLLHQIDGFENARYEDPYAGGHGNSIRYIGIASCGEDMRAEGVHNLFCAGEKSAPIVGHTEAIITGTLAGHNAVRCVLDMTYLALPTTLATGDFISFVHRNMNETDGMKVRYTFSGSVYFERMKEKGLYSTDPAVISARVNQSGLAGIFDRCLV